MSDKEQNIQNEAEQQEKHTGIEADHINPAGLDEEELERAYNESSITVLEGIEAVRKRPAMYIGDTGVTGLHHLIYEVVDNAIDEAMAGYCDEISVVIGADGSCAVRDNGRGIPIGPMAHSNPEINGKPAVEVCMTVLHAGGKFDRHSYKVSGGLHGVGVSVVNALSEWLRIQVRQDGKIHEMSFARGRTASPLKVIGEIQSTGTRIKFKPDAEIFPDCEFRYDTLKNRMRELAYLNNGVRIKLSDERSGQQDEFHYTDGLRAFVEHLTEGKEALHETISMRAEDPEQKLVLEMSLLWNDGYNENVVCFANNIRNIDGGTHLSGFRSALTRTMNNYARRQNLIKGNLSATGEDFREGLAAVISVKVPEPQFEAQTKVRLMNPEVQSFVESTLNDKFNSFLEEHPTEAKRIVSKGVQAAQAREAARKARDLTRKSAMSAGGMPSKLWDCRNKDAETTELFIVEGQSAGGSAKTGRDSAFQAILPLKGKILNVEKARIDKMLSHEEIKTLIIALGCGIGDDEFDITKRRYGKIVLMCDADVDGSHIRTLLLTFLFRHMRPLVEGGYVYIAQPPLYLIKKGKKSEYILNEAILNRKLTELGLDGTSLVIRKPGEPEREIVGDDMTRIYKVLEGIIQQGRVLSRRGINKRELIQTHMDENGRLPSFRAEVYRPSETTPIEHYGYSDEEFERFCEEEKANYGEVVVVDTGAAGIATGQEATAEHRIENTDLDECRVLENLIGQLRDMNLSMEDYYAEREEQVDGTLPPANYLLKREGEVAVELDNLRQVVDRVRSLGGEGIEFRRFKGLGEMNGDQLWQTTMDPENRGMLKVVISDESDAEQLELDAREADRTFSILMGDNVEARRQFIETNAAHVKNLDI